MHFLIQKIKKSFDIQFWYAYIRRFDQENIETFEWKFFQRSLF